MRISTKSNIAAVAKDWKRLSRVYKKAVISGLNKTAYRVSKEDHQEVMGKGIDRPVKFTTSKKAMRYSKANINRPVAYIHVSPKQAEYLQNITFGGRGKKGKAVPVKIPLNKWGNIASLKAGKKVKDLLAKPGYFAETFGGVSGIFRKKGQRLEMVIYFSEGKYRYKKQYPWHDNVKRAANKRFPKAMNEALNKVIRAEAARAIRVSDGRRMQNLRGRRVYCAIQWDR